MEPPAQQSPYPLPRAAIDQFRADGHVLLRSVAGRSEIEACRTAISEAVRRLNTDAPAIEERDTYQKAFLKGMNLWPHDVTVRNFVLSPKYARLAAELLGVPSVRIYHDQALYKEPGGGPTPWHQDQYYWPLDTDLTVTMWMPLVDLSADMGTLIFASQSHRGGYLGEFPISDKSDEIFGKFVREKNFPLFPPSAMAAGDATFHMGWTLHAAPGNSSDRMREVMTVIYFADGARVLPPDNPNRARDMKRWLPGCKPGDLAASHLNPIAYRSS